MGSDSDLNTLKPAIDILREFRIKTEVCILSAHRTPIEMMEYAKNAESENIKVIIAGAGGAAHLPGMLASITCIPVVGVPVERKTLKGIDSLLSIVQMPAGIPVATVAINGGQVPFTSTDQKGNFRIGSGLEINQTTSTISGRDFNRAIQANLTPLILALGG